MIPQLVWRGTDFGYLANVHPEFRRPLNDAADADVLRSKYDNLVPRWKGVILTSDSEAEHEANQTPGTVPLINIKFSNFLFEGKSTPTQGHNEFLKWEEVGIKASGEHMNSSELAQYKYHIDLGGGGGTTWAGTVQKVRPTWILMLYLSVSQHLGLSSTACHGRGSASSRNTDKRLYPRLHETICSLRSNKGRPD